MHSRWLFQWFCCGCCVWPCRFCSRYAKVIRVWKVICSIMLLFLLCGYRNGFKAFLYLFWVVKYSKLHICLLFIQSCCIKFSFHFVTMARLLHISENTQAFAAYAFCFSLIFLFFFVMCLSLLLTSDHSVIKIL